MVKKLKIVSVATAVILILVSFYLLNVLKLVFLLDNYATTPSIAGKEFNVIIIPGQGVRNGSLLPDGERRDVQARLQFAAEIFDKQTIKPILILSGYGRGYRDRDEQNQEAPVMYTFISPLFQEQSYITKVLNNRTALLEYSSQIYPRKSTRILHARYNPEQYILLENQSHHTIENALYSQKLLPAGTDNVLVLAPAKSFQRVNLAFSTIWDDSNDADISIYSLTNQTAEERNSEWFRTAGTILVLALPGEKNKELVGKWLFLLLADESCRKEGYIFNEIICDPHR